IYTSLKLSSDAFEDVAENDPVLLMDGSTILYDNLKKTNVSESDLIAKLREANVLRLDQVMAVVMETTGDISVLHQEGSEPIDDIILQGVQR
ncbi:MAG: YetF domain-containing protein, partial [Lewinella sp.]